MKKDKILYLFTGGYPYGNKIETFLETEIGYLSNSFSEVNIITKTKEDFIRETPRNIKVINEFAGLYFSKIKKLFFLIKYFYLTSIAVKDEINDRGFFNVLKSRKVLFDLLATELIIFEKIDNKFFISKGIKDFSNIIIYDYWFENFTLSLSFLKRKYSTIHFVARGHRFDIYDEEYHDYGVKFRSWKLKNVDILSLISEEGLQYIKSRVNKSLHSKLVVNYLGVKKNNETLYNVVESDTKLIVSCSSLLTRKNVQLIPLILAKCTSKIHWIHFGSGHLEDELKKVLSSESYSFTYELKGHVNNISINDFYKKNKVDLFLSLSLSEGLPVSMMEAQSFGIPIISYPVGGIPELVIDGLTGKLLSLSMSIEEISKVVDEQLSYSFSSEKIIRFFDENFNSDNNYPKFIKETLCLEK